MVAHSPSPYPSREKKETLNSIFLNPNVVEAAQHLLGKGLFTKKDGHLTGGIITETEAYLGVEDKASHAYGGRRTKRTEIMYQKGGVAYVYLCYGIHSLLNVITGEEGVPHAVLIRALQPTHGIEIMLKRRGKKQFDTTLTNGPGALTLALGITLKENGLPLDSETLWIEDLGLPTPPFQTTPRIGVHYAEEWANLPYRFVAELTYFIRPTLVKAPQDIFIIGPGLVGKSLSASLLYANSNNRVFLVGKHCQMINMHENGLQIKGAIQASFQDEKRLVLCSKIDNDLIEGYEVQQEPIVFLTTKTYHAVPSIEPFRETLSRLHPSIICLQNGLGIECEVKQIFPSDSATVLKGHVFGAIHYEGSAVFSYKGRIMIETADDPISDKLKTIFNEERESIFTLDLSSDILREIYPKVTVNCVCNPLTVILNKPLGEIRAEYESLIRVICREVHAVAIAQKFDLLPTQQIEETVLKTMSMFADHYSSTYHDHEMGRDTEIDYINGAILKIADESGINVPVTRLLVKVMKEIASMRRDCKSSEEFYEKHVDYLEGVKQQLRFSLRTYPNIVSVDFSI